MTLHIQRPNETRFLDQILSAATGATGGGGVFAFATEAGIAALLDAPEIQGILLGGGEFELHVGLDAITTPEALLKLTEYAGDEKYGGRLKVGAFLHSHAAIFHPKLVWFQRPDGLVVLVGSGNLTPAGLGGLRGGPGNWEAYMVLPLGGEEATATKAYIETWLSSERDDDNIVEPSSAEAMKAAMGNYRLMSRRRGVVGPREAVRTAVLALPADETVLVRELSDTRTGQAELTKAGAEFLGYGGAADTVVLQYVSRIGQVSVPYRRPLFRVSSNNYRMEIPEIRLEGYERTADHRRSFLLVVKVAEAAYRYSLIGPSAIEDYASVEQLVGPTKWRGTNQLMRMKTVTLDQLMTAWPTVPSALLPNDVSNWPLVL